MKITRLAFRSLNDVLNLRSGLNVAGRALSTNAAKAPFESTDEFEKRIFEGFSGKNDGTDAFYSKLDKLEKEIHDRRESRFGSSSFSAGGSTDMDGLDDSFNALSDGMDGKLKKSAAFFKIDDEEVLEEDYSFRPDVTYSIGDTYDLKDLDLKKPGFQKPRQFDEFEVTTEEALRKADFRNVRFLANFITEGGIIIKRSTTGISAKAQRKVAREIKTARAFGLLPFTTMGTKAFAFGKSMEENDRDFEFESNDRLEDDEAEKDSFEP